MSVIPVNALTIRSIQNSLNSKETEITKLNKYALQNKGNFNKENKNLNLFIVNINLSKI